MENIDIKSGKERLEELITAALADGEITEGEMKVLTNKAKSLGIDEDEFKLEIEAKNHLNVIKEKKKKSKKFKKKYTAGIVIIGLNLIVWGGMWINYSVIPSIMASKFEKAISNYDFQKAYSMLGDLDEGGGNEVYICDKNIKHQKLLKSAIPYYLDNNHIDIAIQSIDEYQFQFASGKPSRNFLYTGQERQSYNTEADFYNILLLDIANYYIDKGEANKAKQLINRKLKPYTAEDNSLSYSQIERKLKVFNDKVNQK